MTPRTAEQIAAAADAENLTGRRNAAFINAAFHAQDDSDKWPICGRFNVTSRAILRTRKLFREAGETCEGLAYALALEACMSEIVNAECA